MTQYKLGKVNRGQYGHYFGYHQQESPLICNGYFISEEDLEKVVKALKIFRHTDTWTTKIPSDPWDIADEALSLLIESEENEKA